MEVGERGLICQNDFFPFIFTCIFIKYFGSSFVCTRGANNKTSGKMPDSAGGIQLFKEQFHGYAECYS